MTVHIEFRTYTCSIRQYLESAGVQVGWHKDAPLQGLAAQALVHEAGPRQESIELRECEAHGVTVRQLLAAGPAGTPAARGRGRHLPGAGNVACDL